MNWKQTSMIFFSNSMYKSKKPHEFENKCLRISENSRSTSGYFPQAAIFHSALRAWTSAVFTRQMSNYSFGSQAKKFENHWPSPHWHVRTCQADGRASARALAWDQLWHFKHWSWTKCGHIFTKMERSMGQVSILWGGKDYMILTMYQRHVQIWT